MSVHNPWRVSVLSTLWVIHLYILSDRVTLVLITYSLKPSNFVKQSPFVLIYNLSFMICLMLEIYEIREYISKRLRPSLYLFSQIFKSAVYSIALYSGLRFYHRYRYQSQSVLTVGKTLTFYIGLAYAIYVFLRHRRGRKHDSAIRLDSTLVGGVTVDHELSMSVSTRLNLASSLQSEQSLVMQMVRWTNQDVLFVEKLPPPLKAVAGSLVYVFKCVVCSLPMLLFLVFTDRLPGEPHSHWTSSSTTESDEWNYVGPDTHSNSFLEIPRNGLRVDPTSDEESAINTSNFHHTNYNDHQLDRSNTSLQYTDQNQTDRLLRPRYLCFLTDEGDDLKREQQYVVMNIDDWLAHTKTRVVPDYVFVSYTRRQFYTQTVFDAELPPATSVAYRAASTRDRRRLTDIAVSAAKKAGVAAFWIDCECIRSEESETTNRHMMDVYRICDIVRAAHSMAIVLGPTLDHDNNHVSTSITNKSDWLHEWGTRMWTVPEALLCPSEHRIAVYTDTAEPEWVAKRNLAARVWHDADALRQLIDHYEASIHLTQLELISIALDCLQRRCTDPHSAGDVAYVLMGLLRLRPKVDKDDTDFQAFARLSLANDSDKILERILCLQNPKLHSPWQDMQDLWGAKLWYMEPMFQIADIGTCNTVIIGDASGTAIDWTSLKPVDFHPADNHTSFRFHYSRYLAASGSTCLFFYFWFACELIPSLNRMNGYNLDLSRTNEVLIRAFGAPFILVFLCSWSIPALLARHFRRPLAATQARMFGVEGVPDLNQVESLLFGASTGRLRWSGESLRDGQEDDDDRPKFTLIDTLTRTATVFRADKPPTMAFVGARERGLMRLLLCSYDHITGSFVKETVLRTESIVFQRLPRLSRFQFAVTSRRYRDEPSQPPRRSIDSNVIDIPDIPEFRSLDGP